MLRSHQEEGVKGPARLGHIEVVETKLSFMGLMNQEPSWRWLRGN